MLFGQKESVEDKIIGLLLEGSLEVKSLHERLSKTEPVSLRAVYKAVTALVAEGVLLKVGKRIFIDQEWLKALRDKLLPTSLELAPGEKAVYTFTTIGHLDAFWKTLVLPLEEGNRSEPIFIYDPHNFWAYVPERKESEDAYYAHFAQQRKYGYFAIGGTNVADMEFKKSYQNDFLQVDMRIVPVLGRRDHTTVLGELVLTARMSAKFSNRLDELYNTNKTIHELLPEILAAYKEAPQVKFILEHNAAKARKLTKMFSVNFYIPLKE